MCGEPAWMSASTTTEKPARAGGQPGTATSVRRTTTRAGSIATDHTATATMAATAPTAASRHAVRLPAMAESARSVDHEGRHASAAGTDVDDRAARGARDRAHVRAGHVEGIDVDFQ